MIIFIEKYQHNSNIVIRSLYSLILRRRKIGCFCDSNIYLRILILLNDLELPFLILHKYN